MTASLNSSSWRERIEYWAEQIAGGPGSPGGGSATTDALLQTVVGLLTTIQAQTDGIELTSDNISLNASAINLNTDSVELLLASLINQVISVEQRVIQGTLQPELILTETHVVLNGSEQPLGLPNTQSQGILLKAVRADGTPNTSPVKLGSSSGALRFRLYPEDEKSLDPPPRGYLDMNQIIVQGAAGDGIAIWSMSYGTPNA